MQGSRTRSLCWLPLHGSWTSNSGCSKPTLINNNSTPSYAMLYTLALILIIAWLLGLVSDYTMGGFIHILLVVAIVMVLVRLIRAGRP